MTAPEHIPHEISLRARMLIDQASFHARRRNLVLFIVALACESAVAAWLWFPALNFGDSDKLRCELSTAASLLTAIVASLLAYACGIHSRILRYLLVLTHMAAVVSIMYVYRQNEQLLSTLIITAMVVTALFRKVDITLTATAILAAALLGLQRLSPSPAFSLRGYVVTSLAARLAILTIATVVISTLFATLGRWKKTFLKRTMQQRAAMEILPQAIARLRSSEMRFRSLSSSSPIGILQTDINNRCVYANERWASLTELPIEKSLDAGWLNAIHIEDRVEFLRQWTTALATDREVVGVFRLARLHTECRWGRFRVAMLRSEDGQTAGYLATVEDTTEAKKAELEMQTAAEVAANASRTKSDFLANMSHEIRTPMTAILGFADRLLRPHLPPAERDLCVRTIQRNGQHLLNIINDILDISKIEAGRMTVERIPSSVVTIVYEVAELMKLRATEKGLDFSVDYKTPIPQSIRSDPTRLRQILMNLLANAIKFTRTGSVRLVISLDSRPDSQTTFLQFDVIDTGIGIRPDQQLKLLAPFAQADTGTTRQFGGTGLGLVISLRLAEMLGGTIKIKSEAGLGSTFSLIVATGVLTGVRMLTDPANAVLNTPTASVSTTAEVFQGRVLLAEDGEDNQQLMEMHLTEMGLHVDIVSNGRLAFDRVMREAKAGAQYDVILMDMQMPEMDGYTAAKKLRDAGYKGPVIALTAHAMAGDREKCEAAGCSDYVTKPIAWDVLNAKLRKHVKVLRTPPVEAKPLASTLENQPKMAPLITSFLSRLPARLRDMREALLASDFDQLNCLAHQLKGAAAGFGFPSITDSAAKVETLLRDQADTHSLTEEIHNIQHLCDLATRHQAPPVAVITPTRTINPHLGVIDARR